MEAVRAGVDASGLSEHLKELAKARLMFADEYIEDGQRLQDLIRPGRLIIVDLRDEYIEKDEALGLFVVMLQILSDATYQGKPFNKLVVFDEAHKIQCRPRVTQHGGVTKTAMDRRTKK